METFFKYGNFLLEVSGSFWKFPNPNLELGSFGALQQITPQQDGQHSTRLNSAKIPLKQQYFRPSQVRSQKHPSSPQSPGGVLEWLPPYARYKYCFLLQSHTSCSNELSFRRFHHGRESILENFLAVLAQWSSGLSINPNHPPTREIHHLCIFYPKLRCFHVYKYGYKLICLTH